MNFWIKIFLVILIFLLFIILLVVNYTDCYRYINLNEEDLERLDREYKYKKKLKNCIITVTTTPNRLKKMKNTLISLLDSSLAVEEIRINIPYYSCKGVKYEIPDWLRKLKSVNICRNIKDLGPATKLLPTLLDEKNSNKKIIVVDNDVIYGYYMVETINEYFEKYNRNGKKVAVTMYGDEIGEDDEMKYDFMTRTSNYLSGEKYVDVLRGHSAYMITPDMFTEDIYDYSCIPKECFFVDDNYFSFHLKRNKVRILMVGLSYKAIPLPDTENYFIDGLHRSENKNGKNEIIVNKYFKDF